MCGQRSEAGRVGWRRRYHPLGDEELVQAVVVRLNNRRSRAVSQEEHAHPKLGATGAGTAALAAAAAVVAAAAAAVAAAVAAAGGTCVPGWVAFSPSHGPHGHLPGHRPAVLRPRQRVRQRTKRAERTTAQSMPWKRRERQRKGKLLRTHHGVPSADLSTIWSMV